jgi:hypothetical protein
MTSKQITAEINYIQRFFPGTRRQKGSHGANRYSVQLFDKATGALVADYDLIGMDRRNGWKPMRMDRKSEVAQ